MEYSKKEQPSVDDKTKGTTDRQTAKPARQRDLDALLSIAFAAFWANPGQYIRRNWKFVTALVTILVTVITLSARYAIVVSSIEQDVAKIKDVQDQVERIEKILAQLEANDQSRTTELAAFGLPTVRKEVNELRAQVIGLTDTHTSKVAELVSGSFTARSVQLVGETGGQRVDAGQFAFDSGRTILRMTGPAALLINDARKSGPQPTIRLANIMGIPFMDFLDPHGRVVMAFPHAHEDFNGPRALNRYLANKPKDSWIDTTLLMKSADHELIRLTATPEGEAHLCFKNIRGVEVLRLGVRANGEPFVETAGSDGKPRPLLQ
jgi:hypothetical protein